VNYAYISSHPKKLSWRRMRGGEYWEILRSSRPIDKLPISLQPLTVMSQLFTYCTMHTSSTLHQFARTKCGAVEYLSGTAAHREPFHRGNCLISTAAFGCEPSNSICRTMHISSHPCARRGAACKSVAVEHLTGEEILEVT
jgi:hypothetical protein